MKLTANQIKAVGLMAEGVPYHAIASRLGVTTRTVERWAVRPDIKQAVQDTQGKAIESLGEEIFEKCRMALSKGLPKAVRQVIQALDHPDARIQIRAAEAIAKWSGFYQPSLQAKPNQLFDAEQNLKGYLAYLETTNGNGNQHNSVR